MLSRFYSNQYVPVTMQVNFNPMAPADGYDLFLNRVLEEQ